MPIVLTSENRKEYLDGKNAIVDFHATWCGPCKMMKPFFEKAEKFAKEINLNVSFLTCDVDDEGELATEFDIEAMPTIFLIKEGKKVEKRIGPFYSSEDVMTFIGRHFDVKAESESDNETDESINVNSTTNTSSETTTSTSTTSTLNQNQDLEAVLEKIAGVQI